MARVREDRGVSGVSPIVEVARMRSERKIKNQTRQKEGKAMRTIPVVTHNHSVLDVCNPGCPANDERAQAMARHPAGKGTMAVCLGLRTRDNAKQFFASGWKVGLVPNFQTNTDPARITFIECSACKGKGICDSAMSRTFCLKCLLARRAGIASMCKRVERIRKVFV